MQILEVRDVYAMAVETNENPWNQYTRYGHDAWFVSMGESQEPVYDCEEIERAYQEYIKKKYGG